MSLCSVVAPRCCSFVRSLSSSLKKMNASSAVSSVQVVENVMKFTGRQENFKAWCYRLRAKIEASDTGTAVLDVPLRAGASQQDIQKILNGRQEVESVEEEETVAADVTAASSSVSVAGADSSSSSAAPAAPAAPKVVVKKTKPTAAELAKQDEIRKQEKAMQDRIRRSRQAYSYILQCLPESLVLQAAATGVVSGDAYGLWKMLVDRFERKTVAVNHHLLGQLSQSKMEPGERFDSFLTRIQEIENRLRQNGQEVNDGMMLFAVMNGLPMRFNTLRVALKMQPTLTLETAVNHIRDHEEQMVLNYEQMNAKKNPNPKDEAHFARTFQNGKGNGNGNHGNGNRQFNKQQFPSSSNSFSNSGTGSGNAAPKGPCFACGENGHIMYDCPQMSKAVKCNRCRRIGHTAADNRCPPMNQNRNGGFRPRNDAASNNGVNHTGMHAASSKNEADDDPTDEWVHLVASEEELNTTAGCTSTSTGNGDAPRVHDMAASVVEMKEVRPKVHASAYPATTVTLPPNSQWLRGPPKPVFLLDTGSTKHMCKDASLMSGLKEVDPITVRVASNQTICFNEVGEVQLPCQGVGASEGGCGVKLSGVLYGEHLAANLISVAKLVDAGAVVQFQKDKALIMVKGVVVSRAPRKGMLWVMQTDVKDAVEEAAMNVNDVGEDSSSASPDPDPAVAAVAPQPQPVPAIVVNAPSTPVLAASPPPDTIRPMNAAQHLHAVFGHASASSLHHVLRFSSLRGLEKMKVSWRDLNSVHECDGCAFGKSHRHPFGHRDPSTRAVAVMEAWHCDLAGPVYTKHAKTIEAVDGGVYVLVVVDEYSHKVFGIVLKKKSDTIGHLISLHRLTTVQTGKQLKRVHSDGGGEFAGKRLLDYWSEHGVEVTSTPPHTPQRNGIAERMMRTLFERARSIQHAAGAPDCLWTCCVMFAVYLGNRLCSRGSSGDGSKTAEELWSGKKPSMTHLRTPLCDVFVLIPDADRLGKMDRKARKCIFVGYDEKKHAYRCYDPVEAKMISSRDCQFHQQAFTMAQYLTKQLDEEDATSEHQRRAALESRQAEWAAFEPASSARPAARAATHRMRLTGHALSKEELEEEEMKMAQQMSLEEMKKKKVGAGAGGCAEEEEKKESKSDDEDEDEEDVSGESKDSSGLSEEEEQKSSASSSEVRPQHKHKPKKKSHKKKKKSALSTSTPSGYPLLSPGSSSAAVAAGRGVQVVRPLTRHQLRQIQQQKEDEAHVALAVLVMERMNERKGMNTTAGKGAVPGKHARLPLVGLPVGVGNIPEPKTFREVLSSPYKEYWLEAVVDELQSMRDMDVFEKVRAAVLSREGRRAIGCKWIFKVKYLSDGRVDRFKARLVAQGFSQREGIDFKETFAPVMMYKSMRVMLVGSCALDYEIKQMDVQTAFLYGDMEEVVYMRMPPGMEYMDGMEGAVNTCTLGSAPSVERGGDGNEYVLRLKKALYGTKQASRQWYQNMNTTLRMCGFQPCVTDPCVYVKQSRTGQPMWIGLFVDDLLPQYHLTDEEEWKETKAILMNRYKMKDLGDAEWVLGMKIHRDRKRRTLKLDQSQYLERVLKEFGMEECKPLETPEEVGVQLTKQDQAHTPMQKEEMVNVPYMELVGSLLYASISTRPDICHAVSVCSRFMNNPGVKHWMAAKRICRYIRGSMEQALNFQPSLNHKQTNTTLTPHNIHATTATVRVYCDADWAGDVDDRRSTSGCVLMLFGCPVVWLSKKQTTVALSTAEAEYMALSLAVSEAKWLKQFVSELGFVVDVPIPIHTDNQAALAIASSNAIAHSRTKHIDIRHHYVREAVDEGWIRIEWVDTKNQVADVFTKALPKQTFKQLTEHIIHSIKQ